MENKVTAAVQRVMELVDQESRPSAMTQTEARDFYVNLADEIDARLEGVESDLRAAKPDDD